jgi:hypothetical protein
MHTYKKKNTKVLMIRIMEMRILNAVDEVGGKSGGGGSWGGTKGDGMNSMGLEESVNAALKRFEAKSE